MDVNTEQLKVILERYLSSVIAGSLLRAALERSQANPAPTRAAQHQQLFVHMQRALRLYLRDAEQQASCEAEIRQALNLGTVTVSAGVVPTPAAVPSRAGSTRPRSSNGHSRHAAPRFPEVATATAGPESALVVQITNETDLVISRLRGMDICRGMGFPMSAQIKVATAISELARNIVLYAGSGEIEFAGVETDGRRGIEIIARDSGPGIANLDEIMSGHYRSRTGMGMGLLGTKRLADEFSIDSKPDKGTTVVIRKYL